MITNIKKDIVVLADSPQTGFVNIMTDPNDISSVVRKVDTGAVVGKLTGNHKIFGQILFVELVYDERSLTNWIEDKGYVNASLVTDSANSLTKPYYITAKGVNVRNTPSTATDANIVRTATKSELIGYSSGEKINGFIKLFPAKGAGIIYVSALYLTTDKSKIPADSVSSTVQNTDTSGVSIIVDDLGDKKLNVLGAKIPVNNTDLITYTAIIAVLGILFVWLKKKFKR